MRLELLGAGDPSVPATITFRQELGGEPGETAARADLLRRLGRRREAAEAYRDALALVTNAAEKRYLEKRLAECVRD